MYALGIHREGSCLRVALLHKIKNKIAVELIQEYEPGVKLLDILKTALEGKNVIFATGLEPTEMVRRDLHMQLKREKTILAALPFQAEALIPYPQEDLILVPRLYPESGGGTHVLLFATTKNGLEEHLKNAPVDPDQVSATGVALARWGAFKYPEKKSFCVMQGGCCVVTVDGKISVLQAYDHPERMKAFVQAKFPELEILEPEDPYAIPIGLALDALEGNGLQFRRELYTSERELQKKVLWQRMYAAACCTLAAAILGIGFFSIHKREARLHTRLDGIAGFHSGGLEERVNRWEEELSSQMKSFPLVPNTPPLRDVLAWLSSKKHEINVTHLNYALIKYPKLGESHEPYQVKVILEFTAPTPTVAREFYDSLLEGDPLVNTKHVVTWDASQNTYKISFIVRAQ